MTNRCALAFGFAVVAAGCADRRGQVVGPPSSSVEAQVHAVARAFAVGMAVPEVRAAVRDAMRASRLTEHKLSLHEFAVSAEGELLLRAAAQGSGTGLDALRALIAKLPELDFYLPARHHRLTWRGTADYMVGVSLNGRPSAEAYLADGGSVPLDLSRAEPPPRALLMLQSAETKSPRIDPQPDRPGLTIQDPDDGELSGSLVFTNRSGATRIVYLADLATLTPEMRDTLNQSLGLFLSECDPENAIQPCDGGGGSSPPGGGTEETFLEEIGTNGVVDNDNPFESNEFEYRAVHESGTNAIRVEDVPSTGQKLVHRHLIFALPPMQVCAENCTASARETDGFPSGDDLFFCAQNCAPNAGYTWVTIENGTNHFYPTAHNRSDGLMSMRFTWVQ